MSRSVRRVALDFEWPLDKVWSGYLNPYYDLREKCADCNGDGGSEAWRLVHALWYRHLHYQARMMLDFHTFPAPLAAFAEQVLRDAPTYRGGNGTHGGWGYHIDQGDVDALVKAGRLWDFTRRPLNAEQETFANGGTKEANGYRPSAEEVNTWATKGMGHDSLNAGVCVRARLKRYRVSSYCPTCHGKGYMANRSISAKIARWRETEPPAGEGWQLWETVSEGSPVSPVFGTAEALATWLSCHYKGMGWKSRETWLRFIEREHPESVSFVVSKGVLMDGIDAITYMEGA